MATLSPQQSRTRSSSAPSLYVMATLPPASNTPSAPPAGGASRLSPSSTTRGVWDRIKPKYPPSQAPGPSQRPPEGSANPYAQQSTPSPPWRANAPNTVAWPHAAPSQPYSWQQPSSTRPHRPSLPGHSYTHPRPPNTNAYGISDSSVSQSMPDQGMTQQAESSEDRDLRLALAASQEAFQMDNIRRESVIAEAERLDLEQARRLSEREAEEWAVLEAITREAEERLAIGKGKAKMTNEEREALELATAMSLSMQEAKSRDIVLPHTTGSQANATSSAGRSRRPPPSSAPTNDWPLGRVEIPSVLSVDHRDRPHPHILIPSVLAPAQPSLASDLASAGDPLLPGHGIIVPRPSVRQTLASRLQQRVEPTTGRPVSILNGLIPQDTGDSLNVTYDDAPPAYEDHRTTGVSDIPVSTPNPPPLMNNGTFSTSSSPPGTIAPGRPAPPPPSNQSTPLYDESTSSYSLNPLSPPSRPQPIADAPLAATARPLPPVPKPQMVEVSRPSQDWRKSTIVPMLLGGASRVSLGPIWNNTSRLPIAPIVSTADLNNGQDDDDPFSDSHSVDPSVRTVPSTGATLGVAPLVYSKSADDLRSPNLPQLADSSSVIPHIRRANSHHHSLEASDPSNGRNGHDSAWPWTEDDEEEDAEVRAALERARSITSDLRRSTFVRRDAGSDAAEAREQVSPSNTSFAGSIDMANSTSTVATSFSPTQQALTSTTMPASSGTPESPIVLESEDQLEPHNYIDDRPAGFQSNPKADESLVEGITFGFPLAGQDSLDGSGSFPDEVKLDSEQNPVFVLEAWTWNRLLAFCMWHGRSTIQASVNDLAKETLPYHVSLTVQFTQAQNDGHTRVRLLLELVKPTKSPHRSRFLNPSGALTSSRAPPGIRTCPITGYQSTSSPSQNAVALNSLIVLPKPYLELPVEMSLLASALHEVHLVAQVTLSSHMSRLRAHGLSSKATPNAVALGTLANSIEANSKANGELGSSSVQQEERLTKRGMEWLKRKGLGLVGQSGGRLNERVPGTGLPLPAGASLVTPFDTDGWG